MAAAAWSTVWNWEPTQSSAPPSRTSTVQLRGSIGAWARNGTSYSATRVFAAALTASGWSAFFATLPGPWQASRKRWASASVDSVAFGPRSHSIARASRPFFAAQKFCATTATPCFSSTTWVTPGTALTRSALNDFTRAPNTGACATSAVCRFLRRTSRPNIALPLTLSAESRRRVGLPMSVKSRASFSSTFSGTGQARPPPRRAARR